MKSERKERPKTGEELKNYKFLEFIRAKKLEELEKRLKAKRNELVNIDNEFKQQKARIQNEIDAQFDPKISEIKAKLDSELKFLNKTYKKVK